MALPTRPFGNTGTHPTLLGLGGEGILRTHGRDRDATTLIRTALELGLTYFEAARAYAGCEEYLGHALGRDRSKVLLASKTHNRRARGARAHLDESLGLLRSDWLDVWYIHDVRTQRDLEEISGPGGALEIVEQAKQRGEIRFAGVSGHQDPEILLRALQLYPFDCILMPINPAESCVKSFAETVLPAARKKQLGVVAMKTLCRGMVGRLPDFQGPAPFLRYALSTEGVSLVSMGCDDIEQLAQNVAAVQQTAHLPEQQREVLEQQCYPSHRDLLYYRHPEDFSGR